MGDGGNPEVPADVERVRPSLEGGAFPHPPILPVVAILTLLLGLGIGFGLAPRERPTPPSTQPTVEKPKLPPTHAPAALWPGAICFDVSRDGSGVATPTPAVSPPPGGVSPTIAIAAAMGAYGISEADIRAVRLVPVRIELNLHYCDDPGRPYTWVWEIEVGGDSVPCPEPDPISTGNLIESPVPETSSYGLPRTCSGDAVIFVDYLNGLALEMGSMNNP